MLKKPKLRDKEKCRSLKMFQWFSKEIKTLLTNYKWKYWRKAKSKSDL